MSVRLYPGDQVTIAINCSGDQKRLTETADMLHRSFPDLTFHILDIYTMVPTVLWVQAPQVMPVPAEGSPDDSTSVGLTDD